MLLQLPNCKNELLLALLLPMLLLPMLPLRFLRLLLLLSLNLLALLILSVPVPNYASTTARLWAMLLRCVRASPSLLLNPTDKLPTIQRATFHMPAICRASESHVPNTFVSTCVTKPSTCSPRTFALALHVSYASLTHTMQGLWH